MDTKKWINYWKKGLSDSLKADIDIKKLKYIELEEFRLESLSIKEIELVNSLIDLEEQKINKKKGIPNKESENWEELDNIEVLIAPFKSVPVPEHLIFLKDKGAKFPFWYYANINRNGTLSLPEETSPIFLRKYLEPLADEKTDFVFSTIEKVDLASTLGKESYQDYIDYISYIKSTFQYVAEQDIENYKTEGYQTIHNGIIVIPDEDINAAIGIIHLYEAILNTELSLPLLSSFVNIDNTTQKKPLSVSKFIDFNHLHLGQMGFDFPISISQRKSLYTFIHEENKVFAVNGPPGTGKTTLLQSIVANKIVESAISGKNPSIILACSANNQAVTNIIDSFSKSNTKEGNLQGRWLPRIEGYATYLPANGKTNAELQGINYKKRNGEGLFDEIETYDYLFEAKEYFLSKSSQYLNSNTTRIEDIVKKLQSEIINIKNIFIDAEKRWNQYLQAETLFHSVFSDDKTTTLSYFSDNLLDKKILENDIVKLHDLETKVIQYFNNEPFFRKLFCLFGIKSALESRASEVRITLRGSLIEINPDFKFTKVYILELINKKIVTISNIISAITNWENWKHNNGIKGNPPRNDEEYWDFENLKVEALKNRDNENAVPNCFYDELDINLRHKAFQLALHYWEGRWLIKLQEDIYSDSFKKRDIDSVKNTWYRQAMITPCFVSTFFMAPKFFNYFKKIGNFENGALIPNNPPLFNFIDLLIVDEAGQVAPEVGVATFALAEQAIIVGDINQIEPVWNITGKIDIGNLKESELISTYNDKIINEVYEPKGFLSSSGSIMKMAQNACNYKEDGINEKGVLLVEHRRCYDEIINYCNVLAYKKQLVPLKGSAKNNTLFPPMYCIHVEGNSTQPPTGTSRYNQNEVEAIVKWLVSNKKLIEERYGKVENSVGILTPFVGQKNNLRYALNKAGFDTDVLKIGTVHALQGAERHIVLFSTVYGDKDTGTMFFDRDNKPNLLNVAVSRAKESFIVFANTRILNKNAKTPSGILANHLTYQQ